MDTRNRMIEREIQRFIDTHNRWRVCETPRQPSRYANTMVRIMTNAKNQGWFERLDRALSKHLSETRMD